MPRRSRVSTGQFVFHVLNRAIQGVTLFERPADFEAVRRDSRRGGCVASRSACSPSAVMPNHWHLVLWPLDDDSLSLFMKWLTAAHARQWRDARGTRGRGAVYQGRFKAIAVQHDRPFPSALPLRRAQCRSIQTGGSRRGLALGQRCTHGASRPIGPSSSPRPVQKTGGLGGTVQRPRAEAVALEHPRRHPGRPPLRLGLVAPQNCRDAAVAEWTHAAWKAGGRRPGRRAVNDDDDFESQARSGS